MKRTVCILFLPGLLAAGWAGAASLSAQFELQRPIAGTFAAGQRGRLVIPGEVFDRSRAFPGDLRIMDSSGTQWPFFLHSPKDTAVSKESVPEILNRSFVEGDLPYWQFDLLIPSADGAPLIHNRLDLHTTGHDFVRRVEVFTAETGQPRGQLAAGYLIHFSKQRDAQNRSIRYPDTDIARLHVRIYTSAREAGETFSITGAKIFHRSAIEAEREPVGFTEADVPERDREKGAQTRILDIGFINRPVEFITFAVGNTSFARSVSIHGRNTESEPWHWLGGGEIHQLPDESRNTVTLKAAARWLKVDIFHYDDPPLIIRHISLEAFPRHLVFEAATAGQASLLFRAWDMPPPRYDLKSRLPETAIAALPVYQTLDTAPNETATIHPWRKYSQLLAALAVGAVSLLVIGIIVRMLKHQKLTGN